MTIEVRIRVRSGDIEKEKEARVSYDDDIGSMICAESSESTKTQTEERIQEIIRGMKDQ